MGNNDLQHTPTFDPDIVELSKKHAVRAVCFTLDNQISDITMVIPCFTSWGEPLEVAARKLEETVKYLTMHFTAFKAYQIQIGAIDQDGIFKVTTKYPVQKFPIREQWESSFVNVYSSEDLKEVQFLDDHERA